MGKRPNTTRLALVVALAGSGLAACTRPNPSDAGGAKEGDAATESHPKSARSGKDAGDADATAPTRSALAPEPERCDDDPASTEKVFLFASPALPVAGAPMHVIAVSDAPILGELRLGDKPTVASSATRRGGPPYFWIVDVAAPESGRWTATFARRGCAPGAPSADGRPTTIAVTKASGPKTLAAPTTGVWPARAGWTRDLENVYSAWIEALFDAPDGEMPSWSALHEVIRDPKRNFLYDHLGAGEDSGTSAPVIRPDCADLPYFLRAYFAFKLKLPFGLATCNRGGGGAPPSCHGLATNEDADERARARAPEGATSVFGAYLRGTLADRAHSGSARTPFDDESSDYYPVALTWESLRPGTTYADPYGHVLVVAKRVAQTQDHGGVLYAVDGQPDGTVARKRFWRGNFLYANARELGGPGFKRFRPVLRHSGVLSRATDAEITVSADYGDLSREPGKLDLESFYDAMDDVLSPKPLDPMRALMETLAALEEQVRTRVQSVDNGRKWLAKGQPPAAMPEGPEIFETTGTWEDFSTPSRDLRLLIAIDVVRGFPARVARRPTRYSPSSREDGPPNPAATKSELERVLAHELAKRTVTYTRTDGSPFTVTLAEVLSRATALETAYNPNECVEARWGAPAGSEEASTCHAHAPAEQRARMEAYRTWFHERRRPPRK